MPSFHASPAHSPTASFRPPEPPNDDQGRDEVDRVLQRVAKGRGRVGAGTNDHPCNKRHQRYSSAQNGYFERLPRAGGVNETPVVTVVFTAKQLLQGIVQSMTRAAIPRHLLSTYSLRLFLCVCVICTRNNTCSQQCNGFPIEQTFA